MMYIASLFCIAIISGYYLNILAMAPLIIAAMAFFISKKELLREKIIVLMMVSYLMGILCFTIHDIRDSKSLFSVEKMSNVEYKHSISIVCKTLRSETKHTTSVDGSDKEYIQITGRVLSVEGRKPAKYEKMLIKCYTENIKSPIPGEVFTAFGVLEKPDGRRNPGCFDYALYLKSIGIKRLMTAENIIINESNSGTFDIINKTNGKLYLLKESFLNKLESSAGSETAGLMRAIMFGEKNELEYDLYEDFQKNGTAHVLAVSGLHVGIIYGFIAALWRWKKGKIYFGLIMAFFLAYMTMASFAPSVVRAVLMVWLHTFAKMTNKRYDMCSAAFFVALLMMIHNPMTVFNTGFQMSFMAVLTLSLMLPLIKKFYQGAFLGSIAVQVGLLPYMIYTFNYISLAAVFVNVLVIFLTGIIVPAGLCSIAIMGISDGLFQLISAVTFGLCRIMTELNALTGIEGITVFMVKSPAIGFVAVYYLVLLVFVSEDGRLLFIRKKKKIISVMAISIISLSLLFNAVAGNDFKKSDVVFVDVGQGDCIHLRTDEGKNYFVDGGGSISYNLGKKTLKPYLLKNGVKTIDGAFVTHLHTDHYKGIAELCREGMVEKLFLYQGYKVREEEVLAETGLSEENIIYLSKGQIVNLEKGTFVEVLWPERRAETEYQTMNDETDENDMSLIFKIEHKNREIIATGDVNSECLDALANAYGGSLDSDILKVAHHGSKYSESESFLQRVSPEYAVFQVGKNNFGHPNKGVVEKIRRKGIMIYRNDEDGAVAFDFERNGSIKVRTVKGEQD